MSGTAAKKPKKSAGDYDSCTCGHTKIEHDTPGKVCKFFGALEDPCECVDFKKED